MTVPSGITAAALIEATNYINSKVYGKTLSELKLNISKELETQNKHIDKLSEQLVSEGLAIRSKEKGEDHFLINRRDFIYGKLDKKEELLKLDKLLNELQNKNFINILKNTSEGTGVQLLLVQILKCLIYQAAQWLLPHWSRDLKIKMFLH